jgi:type I restriction enzyme S subunit
MHNLPKNWQVKSLGEVAKVKSGFAFKSEDYMDEGVRLVRIGNLNGSELEFNSNTVFLDEIYLRQYPEFALRTNDVLIAMSGATTGKLALVKKDDLPCLLNQRVGLISIPEDSKLDSRFLFYYLAKGDLRKQVLKMAGGSAQPNISPTQIQSFKIPLPPLQIQKLIAEILEKADEAKQKRKEANKLTEQFLQSAFIEMFGDPVKNPKGWEVEKIKNISSLVTSGSTPLGGNSNYVSNGVLFIRSQNVLMNRVDYSDITFINQSMHVKMLRTWVKKNDVLFNITGASIGRVAYFQGEDDSANVNQHVCIVRPIKEKINHVFLSYLISSKQFQLRIISQNAGATRQAFNFEQVKNFDILLPPLLLQQKFATLVEKTEALKEKQKESEKELENLFNSLMQKAFVGELTN